MDKVKDSSSSRAANKNKGVFMRLVDWIARGAEKAQKGAGQCPT